MDEAVRNRLLVLEKRATRLLRGTTWVVLGLGYALPLYVAGSWVFDALTEGPSLQGALAVVAMFLGATIVVSPFLVYRLYVRGPIRTLFDHAQPYEGRLVGGRAGATGRAELPSVVFAVARREFQVAVTAAFRFHLPEGAPVTVFAAPERVPLVALVSEFDGRERVELARLL